MTDTEARKAECLEIHGAAVAIRRMDHQSQQHAYETLERDKGKDYADRVRKANGLTRKLLDANGMTYAQIRSKK
jgi:hypothetical protein